MTHPPDLTPEHTRRPPDHFIYHEVAASYRYVDSVLWTADAESPVGGYAWHGWAIREAFLAGCAYARGPVPHSIFVAEINQFRSLCAKLIEAAEDMTVENDGSSDRFDAVAERARALLAQAEPAVPASERLPEPNTKVLAHYFNALGNGRTICAIWVPAKSRSDNADLDDDDFLEYDEEDNEYYWPEGWYEAIENWEEYGWVKVYEGEVVYWQPLPKWPAQPTPLPAGDTEP